MPVVISSIAARSHAQRAGILPGETLVSINGSAVNDVLDYRFYLVNRLVSLVIEDPEGRARTVRIRKGEYAEIGLEFSSYLMDEERCCKNKCIFCFIDQMPPGMRESLYFKDDDSRLDFLFGNYITLTNVGEEDIRRIIAMHLSPVNVSVHTTNPELRVAMMKNPRAASSLQYLKELAEAGIALHTQVVLCPGVNDGEELTRTLRDLCGMWPAVESIACVPVGLTKYRERLPHIDPYTKERAAETIDLIEAFQKEQLALHGERIAYPADEFFIKAGRPMPDDVYYGEFTQLENGVGLSALLKREFLEALNAHGPGEIHRKASVATGKAAEGLLGELAALAEEKFPGLRVEVTAVENRFFGETVTVTGLLTGGDIAEAMKEKDLGEELLVCESTLRYERDRFLDDKTPEELEHELGVPVLMVKNDGYSLLCAMLGEEEESRCEVVYEEVH
ncbi:MAG TPA: DUF512 domain-containing protein [Oscillospiraceae bacterium]|nr:DUF512 domain-containing protein [Oscillospiraceae bacterium]HNW04696.1 DUF512 domain-containing protein [Oscillospiraceae bacterium]HPV99428.1 DUF512 domain-containing protein [Oscillospiraceae bacterium]